MFSTTLSSLLVSKITPKQESQSLIIIIIITNTIITITVIIIIFIIIIIFVVAIAIIIITRPFITINFRACTLIIVLILKLIQKT